MTADLSMLDDALAEAGTDGYLIDASQDDPDQLYLSGFTGPDPFLSLYADGEIHLLVSGLEYGRAIQRSRADVVDRHANYGYDSGDRDDRLDMYAEFLAERDVGSVSMPPRGPIETADGLRDRGIEVTVDGTGVLEEIRAVKTDEEIATIRSAQRATEVAMATAEDLIASATIADGGGDGNADGSGDTAGGGDGNADDPIDPGTFDSGTLVHDGEPLTSEHVKTAIEIALLERGFALEETIVACGSQAADPHDRGSGPLFAHEPIIVDIFPRDKETKYFADMTRTFLRGEAGDTLREWYDLTHEALRAATDAIEPGVTGEAVHAAACEVYESAGLSTLRSDPDTETGFIHSTGHGVGLDIHELPRLAPGGEQLKSGQVVTVEPGLYDPTVGGVRIENLVVVTDDGCETLTEYPIELTV
ncbi:M24 family metallopeptidase [Halopenitus sp. H-Gu1]|uniref:M24 family metallopeptidase n=1 Tax=Halopenitus sp. H-Gu1 TaxID=3242697 RepID=UPI00359D516E